MAEKKDRQAWPTGVLTEETVIRDVKRGGVPLAVIYTLAAVVLALTAWPLIKTATDLSLKLVALLVGVAVLLMLACRQWRTVLTKLEYRIQEDRIVGKQMQTVYEDRDAELTGMATRTPVLEFEKHGAYRLDADQIHSGYTAHELYHALQVGEQVYMVYACKTQKLLYIYRAKYWTL